MARERTEETLSQWRIHWDREVEKAQQAGDPLWLAVALGGQSAVALITEDLETENE